MLTRSAASYMSQLDQLSNGDTEKGRWRNGDGDGDGDRPMMGLESCGKCMKM